jgi:hypothetical protein
VGICEERPSQGVATIELLCDDAGHIDGGLGVARGMESASDPKGSAKRTDSNVGQNSPCAVDRHKRCKQKE